jgi:acyl-CoA thioesterase I
MRIAFSSIVPLALLLVACGSDPGAQPAQRSEPATAQAAQPVAGPERRILAFGNSLFAGYGVGLENSYPAQLERALREDGINARIVNAGVSGDTTAAGRQRLAFTLDAQQDQPHLLLLELGANDMLRGLDPGQTRANLAAMLDELAKRRIPVLLMGMRAPPNYGPEYQREFDAIYAELGERPGVTLVSFWLETIYRRPELFQSDRLHPTTEGLGVLVDATKAEVAGALPPVQPPS